MLPIPHLYSVVDAIVAAKFEQQTTKYIPIFLHPLNNTSTQFFMVNLDRVHAAITVSYRDSSRQSFSVAVHLNFWLNS